VLQAVLRGLSTLMRNDVLFESSECDFGAALRLNGLIAQRSVIDPRLPRSSQEYGTLGKQTRGRTQSPQPTPF
jgi:hypothetical protein